MHASALQAEENGKAEGYVSPVDGGKGLKGLDLREAHWGFGLAQSLQTLLPSDSVLMRSWRIFFAVAWSGMVEGKWKVHCHQYDRRAFAAHRQGCTATRPRCLQQPSRLNPAFCTFFPSMIQQNNHRLHSDVHPLPISREKITDDPEEWAVWVGHRKAHPTLSLPVN